MSLVREYKGLEKHFASGFIYYFCTAFQSGSPRVLKLMNRNPNIRPLLSVLKDMDEKNFITYKHTQIIVGFPGESDRDFQDTIDILNQCGFDYVTVTKFSPREGTVAATLPEQVCEEIKTKRYDEIANWNKINRSARLYHRLKIALLN